MNQGVSKNRLVQLVTTNSWQTKSHPPPPKAKKKTAPKQTAAATRQEEESRRIRSRRENRPNLTSLEGRTRLNSSSSSFSTRLVGSQEAEPPTSAVASTKTPWDSLCNKCWTTSKSSSWKKSLMNFTSKKFKLALTCRMKNTRAF